MMGITRSLKVGLFTGSFTQTTTQTYKPHLSTAVTHDLSTHTSANFYLLVDYMYTLYTGLATATVYLNKKETI